MSRRLAGVLVAVAALAGCIVPAAASAQDRVACSPSDYTDGTCLAFAVTGGEKPEIGAVRAAVERGDVAQARGYVKQRAKNHQDSLQTALRALVVSPKASSDVHILNDPENDGIGTITSRWNWRLDQPIIFGYCDPQGCTQRDTLDAHYALNIFFTGETTLDGELSTRAGATFSINNHDCTLYADLSWQIDPNLADWPRCDTAYQTSRYTIYPGNVTQMRRNEWNYLAIGLRFTPTGSDQAFAFNWESRRWYVDGGGSQEFRQYSS
ncbi:hypothetical protein M2283_009431 [Streptomyces pseudovenezuelae]|uniref:Uncharacterized protein n=1 Tax=Streptomyces pseudovenezuelae TaxID=67350 RepID=A0ABT6M0J3_9ACTN|nr:hypothetical protein [Streptomyces pseudovenezuelae]